MLCSSFFWWPARVMPRAGRSLGGSSGLKLGQQLQHPRLPRPVSPCLLQAELSHVTEGAETKPGEVVLIALQSDGRKPGLR